MRRMRLSTLRSLGLRWLLAVALLLPQKVAGQVCSACGQDKYLPGGPTVGARGICEPAFSGLASCDAEERCTVKTITTEKPDPANPGNTIKETRQIRECIPRCNVEGLCGSGGGGGTAARFVNLWDGGLSSWFCPAEYAAWQCA